MKKNNVVEDAQRVVLLAVKVASVINFEEISQLNAVKTLESARKEVFEFLSLFVKADSKDFAK